MRKKVDIEITDKEAEEFYQNRQFQIEFSQIKSQIKNELFKDKYLNQLKNEMDINIKI